MNSVILMNLQSFTISDAPTILLWIKDKTASAIHCYESVGFVVTGSDTYAIDGDEWSGKEMELVIKNNLYR